MSCNLFDNNVSSVVDNGSFKVTFVVGAHNIINRLKPLKRAKIIIIMKTIEIGLCPVTMPKTGIIIIKIKTKIEKGSADKIINLQKLSIGCQIIAFVSSISKNFNILILLS